MRTTSFAVTCAGAILGVSDFAASLAFYRDQLGAGPRRVYEDTLVVIEEPG